MLSRTHTKHLACIKVKFTLTADCVTLHMFLVFSKSYLDCSFFQKLDFTTKLQHCQVEEADHS